MGVLVCSWCRLFAVRWMAVSKGNVAGCCVSHEGAFSWEVSGDEAIVWEIFSS